MEHRSIYGEDLAYIHHVGFGEFSRAAAPGLLKLLRESGLRRGTLVDLGCGSGLWARAAGKAGFAVIGVDRSPAMLRLARRVAPAARFLCASLHEFDFPPSAAVTAVGEGLSYLAPADRGRPSFDRLFARVAAALQPGGLLVFDVLLSGGRPISGRHWRVARNWAVLTEVQEQAARRVLIRRIISFRRLGARWRRGEEIHRIRLVDREAVRRSLVRAGFSVRTARRYGAVPLLPRRLIFIARKIGGTWPREIGTAHGSR